MNLFSQQIKTNKFKKCEILKKKFFSEISKLEKSEQNRLLDNFREILYKKKSTMTHFCVIVESILLLQKVLVIHRIFFRLTIDFVLPTESIAFTKAYEQIYL